MENATHSMKHDRNPVALFVATMGFVMFSYFTYADRTVFLESLKSLRWIKTSATIISVENNSFEINSANQYVPSSSTRYYEVKCTYQYRVGDTTYHGDRCSFGGHVDQDWPRLFTGDRISIYYNKDSPAQSVAKKGVSKSILFSPVMAMASLTWMLLA